MVPGHAQGGASGGHRHAGLGGSDVLQRIWNPKRRQEGVIFGFYGVLLIGVLALFLYSFCNWDSFYLFWCTDLVILFTRFFGGVFLIGEFLFGF